MEPCHDSGIRGHRFDILSFDTAISDQCVEELCARRCTLRTDARCVLMTYNLSAPTPKCFDMCLLARLHISAWAPLRQP